MKKLLIVGNFKSNKTTSEALDWFDKFSKDFRANPDKEIVICPSFTSIPYLHRSITDRALKIYLGAQNISLFEEGPFTGEINAEQIKEFCRYCLVGHSERRSNFSEDLESINKKIKNLIRQEITPIVCISELNQIEGIDDLGKCIIAFEPISAVGSGQAEDPGSARSFAEKLRQTFPGKILYGGSVDSANVSSYTSSFDGVLVGAESLDPQKFLEITNNA